MHSIVQLNILEAVISLWKVTEVNGSMDDYRKKQTPSTLALAAVTYYIPTQVPTCNQFRRQN